MSLSSPEGGVNWVAHLGVAAACMVLPLLSSVAWVQLAKSSYAQAQAEASTAAAASAATPPPSALTDAEYCSADLKRILRRVLQSCGLQSSGEVRGCQPMEARKVANMASSDFNALFLPMAERAGIIQFDQDSDVLDPTDKALLERVFSDQRGASYFFVVSRASPEGSEIYNRDLSQRRGQAVLDHLKSVFKDPELDQEVGLLWLGEEVAQLDKEFCTWQRSGPTETCQPQDLNRSAFIAWIDCRL